MAANLGGRGSRGFGLAAALLLIALGGACTSDGSGVNADGAASQPAAARTSSDPPAELFARGEGVGNLARAGLGADAAFIRFGRQEPSDSEGVGGGRRPLVATAVDANGVWSELPSPEVRGFYDLASAGDTVVLGGLECTSEECRTYTPRFLVLSEDRSKWIDSEVDLPEVEGDYEGEATAVIPSPRPMGHAVITIGTSLYFVSPDGEVVEPTFPKQTRPDEQFFGCRTDDLEILVRGEAPTTEAPVHLTGMVSIRSLDRLEEGYVDVAPVLDVVVDPASNICGFRELTLQSGATAYTFDLDTNEWTESTSNYREFNFGSTVTAPTRAQIAIEDGTVFERELRRAPGGIWSPLALPEGSLLVFTNGTTVYAFRSEAGEVTVFQR
jgi:hypothetical protein